MAVAAAAAASSSAPAPSDNQVRFLIGNANLNDLRVEHLHFPLGSSSSKAPQTAEEKSRPIQCAHGTGTADRSKIYARALPQVHQRLRLLDAFIDKPLGRDYNGVVTVSNTHGLTAEQAREFASSDAARVVTPEHERAFPSRGAVRPHLIVQRPGKPNRVVVSCDDQNNYAYDAGYRNEITDMQGIADMLVIGLAAAAVDTDIVSAYYHRKLDDDAASHYRFRIDGVLYEFRALPMGLAVSAEWMHIVCNIMAGNRAYVTPEFSIPCRVKCWIDNCCFYASSAKQAQIAQRMVAENADAMGLVLHAPKFHAADSDPTFVFCGTQFDLANGTARPSDKTLDKLPRIVPDSMPAADLQALGCRGIYCAQVMQEPLLNYWFTLKWIRRVTNGVNTGRRHPNETVPIPDSVRRVLQRWIDAARRPHKINKQRLDGTTATLFTDATPTGWGAVLVFNNNRLFSVGGRFPPSITGSICAKEAWAVHLALEHLQQFLPEINELHLFVDNTSVEAGLHRANARADDLVEPIRRAWAEIAARSIVMTVAYVSTSVNPADAISRGEALKANVTQELIDHIKTHAKSLTHQNKQKGAGQRLVVKR
jgi:hypothetical protein